MLYSFIVCKLYILFNGTGNYVWVSLWHQVDKALSSCESNIVNKVIFNLSFIKLDNILDISKIFLPIPYFHHNFYSVKNSPKLNTKGHLNRPCHLEAFIVFKLRENLAVFKHLEVAKTIN